MLKVSKFPIEKIRTPHTLFNKELDLTYVLYDYCYRYNTVIKTYADGSLKIKSSSYSHFKGLSRKRTSGVGLSDEEKKRLRYKNLYNSKAKLIDLVYHNSLISAWEYFVTLTFDPKEVDSLDYREVSDMLAKWTDNMKHQNPNMAYILVPELHKSGRIHWHGVFKNVPNWTLVPARSAKTNRLIYKNGSQIFNLENYKYGHTTVSKIKNQEAVSVYCSKYMTKDMIDLAYKKRYWSSRNLERPTKEYALFDEKTLKFYIDKGEITYQNDKSVFLEVKKDLSDASRSQKMDNSSSRIVLESEKSAIHEHDSHDLSELVTN